MSSQHGLTGKSDLTSLIGESLLVDPRGSYYSKYCLTSSLTTWTMGQTGLSVIVISTWKEWLIHQMVNRLERWAYRMKVNKSKSQVLHLSRNSLVHQYTQQRPISWRAALQTRTWEFLWTTSCPEDSNVHLQNRRPPGLH